MFSIIDANKGIYVILFNTKDVYPLKKSRTLILLLCLSTLLITMSKAQQRLVTFESYASLEKSFDLASDTTYVVNFWATWCKPCVQELPYFEQFNSENKNKAVKVVLVSLDFAKQIDSHLIPFIEKRKLTSQVVFMADKNYNQWLNKVSPEWSGSIPATLLLRGQQRTFVEQEFDSAEELNTWIHSFIKS
jgi:thiol-disulfide isomerase/thioredoxin